MNKKALDDPRYEPNTTHWLKGSVVLHMYDQKHPKMFMKVVGYTRGGLCKTQYVDRRHKRTIWKNELQFLLDPWRWELKGYEDPDEYEKVRLWNFYHPIGRKVDVLRDLGEIMHTKTRSVAWLLGGHSAVVMVDGIAGGYLLDRVTACPGWVTGQVDG